jgi:PKD repeat protein
MKKIIFTLFAGLLLGFGAFAQNYTVTVQGTVMMVSNNSISPVPDQAVMITVDSTDFGFNYQNTVYTDESGYYEDIISMPGFTGYAYVRTMTLDPCLEQYLSNFAVIMPGATLPSMDFYLCNTINPECEAYFYYYQMNPADPYTFAFENMSMGNYTESFWSFGDSTYSSEHYLVHTFPGPGTYSVCLTITDGGECSSTYCELVVTGGSSTGCENYFFYYLNNNDPYSLTFEGYLLNNQYAQYYWWDFGDGTTGEGQTVTHTYTPQGISMYMVSLTTIVMDSAGMDSCFYTSYQKVWVENQSGCESFILPISMYGLTVDFQGYTISPYETEYTWEFGDSVTGTGEFVSHTYPAPGMYNVYLNTADASGCTYQTFTQIWVDSTNQGGCNAMFSYEQADSTTFTFYGYIYYNNGMIYPDSSVVYSWDFGDGTTGTGQTITHYFQANPAGGYNVCLTATSVMPDGSACTAVYCDYITFIQPSFSIFGYVYLENNQLADQAVAHLMIMDSTWQGVVEVQSMAVDSGGFYNFPNVPMYNTSLYYVQAELTEGSAYFGDYLPTYHLNALSWEQAMPVLPINSWPADIFMIAGSPVESGNGSITGVVSNLGARGYMSDVEVVLMNADKTPLKYTRSDEMGNFGFHNLALGTYVIHAEIMGIHTVQAEVSLSEDKPEVSVEVQVSGDEANVVFGMPDLPIVFESISEIFPNPANSDSRINIVLKSDSRLQVSILSLTGQVVDSEVIDMAKGNHLYRIDSGALPEGFYLYKIVSDQGDIATRKFIILR